MPLAKDRRLKLVSVNSSSLLPIYNLPTGRGGTTLDGRSESGIRVQVGHILEDTSAGTADSGSINREVNPKGSPFVADVGSLLSNQLRFLQVQITLQHHLH
jgi:hypothetical protein